MQEFEKWEKYCIRILSDYLHLLEEWKLRYAPKYPDEEWNEQFVEACNGREATEYYLDILLEGDLAERIEFVKNKGEEVKAIEKRLEQHRQRNNYENGIGGSNHGERLVS